MKKLNLLWIVAFIIQSAFAFNSSVIYPVNTTIYNFTVIVNQPGNFSIQINNAGNQTFYNVTGSPLYPYNFSRIDKLEPNQTGTLYFSVKTNEVFDFSPFYPTIIYFYPGTYVEIAKTVNILINESSMKFYPRNISVNRFDTVCWSNQRINASVIKVNNPQNLFGDISITQGQIGCHQLSESYIGDIEYYDTSNGYTGHLVVENNIKTGQVHDPLNDIAARVLLKSEYPISEVLVENYKNNFSISYDGAAQGVFYVKNNINETIHNMNFVIDQPVDSEVTFSPNEFDLNVADFKTIFFEIKPKISETGKTDKTYNFNVKIQADNIISQSFPISVYIKYHTFGLNGTECDVVAAMRILCKENPSNQWCIGFKDEIIKENVTVLVDKQTNLNLTDREIRGLINRIEGDVSGYDRLGSRLEGTEGTIANNTAICKEAYSMCNESKNQCANFEPRYNAKVKNTNIWVIVIVVLVALSVGGFFLGKYLIKRNKEKKAIAGRSF